MAANTSAIFTLTPHVGMCVISTANTNRDGSGTLGSVITGGTNGTRITRIRVVATGTTTAGMVRLFIYDGSSVTQLWREIVVSAITVGASTPGFSAEIIFSGDQALVLPSGYILKAGTHNAESFSVVADGGDY